MQCGCCGASKMELKQEQRILSYRVKSWQCSRCFYRTKELEVLATGDTRLSLGSKVKCPPSKVIR